MTTSPVKDFFSMVWDMVALAPPQVDPFRDHSVKNLEKLLMISQGMTYYNDLDQVLGYLLSSVREVFGLDCGVLTLEDERAYRIRAHRGFSASFVTRMTLPLGEGILGKAASSGRGLVISRDQLKRELELDAALNDSDWESFLMTPIMLQSQNLGLFLAASSEKNFFSEARVETLQPYLQILAVGMRNAALIEMMEKFNRRLTAEVSSTTQELTQTNERLIRRVRELKALYEITLAAGLYSNLDDIFEAVSGKIADFFGVEYVGFLVNVSGKGRRAELSMRFPSFGLSREVQDTLQVADVEGEAKGPVLQTILDAFEKGEMQYFHGGPVSLGKEFASSVKDLKISEVLDKVVLRAVTAAPLKTAQGAHGILVLANPIREVKFSGKGAPEVLSDEDLRTLTLVSIRIATSIENAALEAQNQRRLQDLSALQEINDAFYATPVLEFVLAKMVRVVTKNLKCPMCDFLLLEPALAELVPHPAAASPKGGQASVLDHIPVKDDKNTISQVFSEKKSRILENVQRDFSLSRLGLEHNIRSMMLVPLKVEQDVIGILRLGSSADGFFDDNHLRLAEIIADRSAVIVQNARLYEKIMQANRELERLNRIKTEFVSMVSHELRTPVTAIKGFVDVVLAEDAGPINEQQRRFLNIAHNSIERLSLLISDLLDISRIEAGQLKMVLQPISIEKVLQESYETYRASIETKKINLALKINKKTPLVIADESRVKQVIDNLISNAMKFTPQGGTINMSVDDLGDFMLVSVADNGVGIKKEEQDKIFSMFYQVDSSLTRKVGGTGLGLSISKGIIEMHGGRIWVESEPGKGSAFRFLLPRYREVQVKDIKLDS